MTLLEIINEVLGMSGFLQRQRIVTSTNPDDIQMLVIANRVARDVHEYYPWPIMRRVGTITPISGQTRYALPDDFVDFVPDSAWQENGSRVAEWPTPDRRWYMYKFSAFSTGGMNRIKKYGNEIEIEASTGVRPISYEYISNAIIEAENGAKKSRFTADTDKFLLNERALLNGIQAEWGTNKMMPQASVWAARYQSSLADAIAEANSARTVGGTDQRFGRRWRNGFSPYTNLYK